jgi:WD40 repeat protein
VATGARLAVLGGRTEFVNNANIGSYFSPDSKLILTTSWDNRTAQIWDATNGRLLHTLRRK